MEIVAGTIEIDLIVTTAAVTLTCVEPAMPFNEAVMVELPALSPVMRPALLIATTAVFDDVHVTDIVRSAEEPSLYMPVAVI
jgi:hypothetical protein